MANNHNNDTNAPPGIHIFLIVENAFLHRGDAFFQKRGRSFSGRGTHFNARGMHFFKKGDAFFVAGDALCRRGVHFRVRGRISEQRIVYNLLK